MRNFSSWRCRHSWGIGRRSLECKPLRGAAGLLYPILPQDSETAWVFGFLCTKNRHIAVVVASVARAYVSRFPDMSRRRKTAWKRFCPTAGRLKFGPRWPAKFHPKMDGKTVLLPRELGQNSARQTATPAGAGCLLFLSFTEAGHGNRRR